MNRPHCQQTDACQSRGPGHCRRCAAVAIYRDPAVRERHQQGLRRFWSDAERSAWVRERAAVRAATERFGDLADKVKGGKTRSRKKLAAIPLDLREEYESLRRDFSAAVARRMIREQVEKDRQRAAQRYHQSLKRQG